MKQEETNIRYRYARPYIPNAVFYIPFGYYYAVRLGTVAKLLSWVLLYIMPTALYSALGFSGTPAVFAINYLLVLIAVFSLYEYGYIINDTLSILREDQPAIRLYEHNFAHFARWKSLILTARLSYAIIALGLLYLFNEPTVHVVRVELAIVLMCLCFAVYNRWRNRYNAWFYPVLVCSRYVPFMLLYEQGWPAYVLLFLSFPLLNAMERFSMPRYRWSFMKRLIPDENSKTRFRVAYYAVVLPVTCLVLYVSEQPIWLTGPIAVLFVYRLVLLYWLKKHQLTNYLNG